MKNQVLTSDSDNMLKLIQMSELKSRISLLARVKSLRYRCWLVSLREIEILKVLIDNYEKIPARTFSKLLTSLFVRSSKMKKILCKLESSLRKNIY